MAGIDDDFFTSAVKPGSKAPAPVEDDFFTGAVPVAAAAQTQAPASAAPATTLYDRSPAWLQRTADVANRFSLGLSQGVLGVGALPNALEGLAGVPEGERRYPSYQDLGKDLGLEQITDPKVNPKLEAPGLLERYAGAIGRGVGGTLGVGGPLALISGAAGGLGGQFAEDVAPGNPYAALAGGTLGGMSGGGLAHYLTAKGLPSLAARFGTGDLPTLQQAGQRMQDAAREWMGPQGGFKTADNAAWDPVHAAIPGSTPVDISGFMDTLNRLRKPAGDLQPVADAALGRNTADLMYAAAQNATTKTQPGAAMSTWDGVKGFRSMLGEAMTNPTLIKDLNDTQKSALYAAITGDMRTAAHGVGPDVGTAFDNANQVSRTLRDKVGSVVGKIVSGPTASSADPDPAKVALGFLNGGKTSGAALQVLRDHLPEAADELTAAHLAGHGVATNTGPAWDKMSPEAQAALVPSTGMRAQVSAAAKAAQEPSMRDLMHGARDTGVSVIANEALATGAGALLGIPGTDLQHGAGGAILGLAAPGAYKVVKRAVKTARSNPLVPTVGAGAGLEDDEARPLTVPVGR